VSLGLSLAAAAAIVAGAPLAGAAAFALALNHKQMALFYAPAFFAHLLGRALRRRGGAPAAARRVVALGAVVLAVFAACWAPYLSSPAAAGRVRA